MELQEKAKELKGISEFISVKIVGSWIWVEGGTKAVKDKLKAAGCKYASKKKAWCWYENIDKAPSKWYRRKTKKLDEIEATYGCEAV